MSGASGFQRLWREVGCLWPAVGIAVGSAAVVGVLGLGAATRAAQAARQVPAPAVIRIPLPSATQTPPPTLVPSVTETPEPSGPVGTIVLGDLVEVFGTSGDGVRLRSSPDLDGTINGLGMDSDVFQVDDGPAEAGDHLWWHLVNPYDTTRQGWAVADYLRPLQGP